MNNIQYTIRNIPPVVDKIIRKRSRQSGKSFNQTVVDLLALQTMGSTEIEGIDNSFDWLFGVNTVDNTFDEAIKDLSQIDEKLWK